MQENLSPGTVLGALSTVDPNALDVFTYNLIAPAPPAAYPSFTLVGNQVVTNKSLDFEATPTLLIIVQATDDSGAFVRKTLTITVIDTNDVSTDVKIVSVSTGAAIAFVDENIPKGSIVGRLQAVDQVRCFSVMSSCLLLFVSFSSQPGNGIVLVCGLLFSQDCCDSYRFALVDDSKTFTLQPGPSGTTQLVTIGNINFEVLSVLTVQFTVDDDRGPSYSTYYNVVVRDINESPTDITLSMPVTRTITLNVDETATIGTLVGTFSSKDPDTWQSFSYKVLNNGAAPPPFYVDQPVPFGTAQLRTNQTLDYDATPQYSVSFHFSVCVTFRFCCIPRHYQGRARDAVSKLSWVRM